MSVSFSGPNNIVHGSRTAKQRKHIQPLGATENPSELSPLVKTPLKKQTSPIPTGKQVLTYLKEKKSQWFGKTKQTI